MCACEPGFTCTRCQVTPFDPHYLDDEPADLAETEFEALVDEPRFPIMMLGEEE